MTSNNQIIKEYATSRDLKKTTYQSIKTILNHYSKFQQMPLQHLLNEADQEEENNTRWKNRTLKKRLTNYQNHCKKTMKLTSAKTYLTIVKSFYFHNDIEIHKLPPVNNKNNANISEPIRYKDLPDKEIIRTACELSSPLMRSLILFLTTTGMSKVDALNLKIQDFINATKTYHQETDINLALQKLTNYPGDIVPTWTNRRSKTNKFYITFNTPETTLEILNYLAIRANRKTLTLTAPLFKIHRDYYTRRFEELNNLMHLGKVGAYNRFRGHMLRKFHASQLKKYGMNTVEVNVLQGKSNGAVDDVYFLYDEEQLREHYLGAMDGLLIFSEVKTVDRYSQEFVAMQNENQRLREQVNKIEVDVENIMRWWVE